MQFRIHYTNHYTVKKLEVDLTQKWSSQLQSGFMSSFCQGLGLHPLSSGGF